MSIDGKVPFNEREFLLRREQAGDVGILRGAINTVFSKIYKELRSPTAEDITSLILEGTDDSTSAVAEYGVNIASTSTSADFACRLPIAKTGRQVIIVNNALLAITIFPSTTGGEINGVVDGSAVVPPDGRAYSFYCTENPLPGAWVWSPPAVAQIEAAEMSVSHTNGAPDKFRWNNGVLGEPNSSVVGAGMSGGPNSTLFVSGSWATLPPGTPGVMTKLKIYTNIRLADFAAPGARILAGVYQAHQSEVNTATHGTRLEDFTNLGTSGTTWTETTGGLVYAGNVGDNETLYTFIDAPIMWTGFQQYLVIGNNFTQGLPDIFSNGFYTFQMGIFSASITKTYKFKFFLEYY